MESTDRDFEGWAIVELFGHNQIAGYVSEVALFGTSMMRVEVPPVGENPGYTKFFGGAAVYAVTPTTEEIAKIAANRLDVRPVNTWTVPDAPRLSESVERTEYPEDYEQEDFQDEDDIDF